MVQKVVGQGRRRLGSASAGIIFVKKRGIPSKLWQGGKPYFWPFNKNVGQKTTIIKSCFIPKFHDIVH